MSQKLFVAILNCVLLSLIATGLAQQTPAPNTEKPASLFVCELERALALVSDQLYEIKAVEPKWRRVDLLTQAAALLWKQRQAKAREVFQSAYDLAQESVAAKEDTAIIVPGGSRMTTRSDLRLEVIRAIAKHDVRWAQQLSDQLLADEKARAEKVTDKDRGAVLYAELPYQAVELLSLDQAAAVRTARQSLLGARGDAIVRFLVALAKQERAAADAFFVEALAALAARSINETLSLSCYPFAVERPIGAGWRSVGGWGAQELQPNPILQVRYLETLFLLAAQFAQQPIVTAAPQDGAYQLSPAARLLTGFNDLEPLVATRFEPLYGRFLEAKRGLAAAVSADFMKTVQSIGDTKREQNTGNAFERSLDAAEREKDPGRKDYQYFNAIQAGINDETQERLESLLFKISALTTRSQLGDWVYYNLAQRAVKTGQFDDAIKLAERVGPLNLRACLSFYIADAALAKNNDRQRATEILESAWRVAEKADVTNEKAKALLGIAHLYLKVERGQALTALRAAVKVINQLENADVSSGRFVKVIKGTGFQHFAGYSIPEMTLGQVFRALGQADFETALSITHELDDKVLRASAVLALSSFCLEKAPAPPTPAKPPAAKPEAKKSGKPN